MGYSHRWISMLLHLLTVAHPCCIDSPPDASLPPSPQCFLSCRLLPLPRLQSELAREAPELAEHAPNGFLSLGELGVDAAPEASFAEIEEHAAPAAQPSLMEVASKTTPPTPWHRDTKNQPVARGEEVTCLDGDCTRATHVQKAKVGTHPNASTKPPPSKLDIALAAVKEEIMVRAKELHQEKIWSDKVTGLIDTYQQKLGKVQSNIVSLRVQTKALLRKKKQIQNVQVRHCIT